MRVEKISPTIDLYTLHKVLISENLTDYDKLKFVKNNRMQIHHLMEVKLSNSEFLNMMQNRPLIRFRPLKNSYTKWGDKIILSKSLGILPSQLSEYVKNVTDSLSDISRLNKFPKDRVDSIKTYVYRHGTQGQVVSFLNYELQSAKNIVQALHNTLEYGNGGMADYFIRPIHRMTNKTLINLYNVVDKNLEEALSKGLISESTKAQISEYALAKIYNIQYNSKFKNAIRTNI